MNSALDAGDVPARHDRHRRSVEVLERAYADSDRRLKTMLADGDRTSTVGARSAHANRPPPHQR
ncbi:MAG: hypothetical protein KC636_35460 [Myxococcales bacterium]|nr:hypothetical protein [Myxococcales bacterium]